MECFETWVENDSSEFENNSGEDDAETIIVNDIKQENLENEITAGEVCPESQTFLKTSRQQR